MVVGVDADGVDRRQVMVEADVKEADDVVALNGDELDLRVIGAGGPDVVKIRRRQESEYSTAQPAGLIRGKVVPDFGYEDSFEVE